MSTYLVDSPSQTVDDLVTSVVSSCRLPINRVTFTPQELIGFMQEEQQLTLTDLMKKIREDFWLTNYDQQILQGVYSYVMPPRAAAGALRNIVFVDAGGFEIDCPHLDPDQIKTPSYFAFRPAWQGQGAFLQNDKVVLWPQTFTNTSYLLRQKYERRPNSLTSNANCMQITGVNVGAQTITFIGSPPFVVGQSLDVIPITGQHVAQAENLLIKLAPGGTITIDPSTPFTSAVTIGSWCCPAGLTCVAQLVDEANALLIARVILRVAAGMQSTNLFSVGTKMAEDGGAKLLTMVTPRVAGSPRKFVNKNVVGGPYSFPYYR